MVFIKRIIPLFFICISHLLVAQPTQGLVWEVPQNIKEATSALFEFKKLGIEAIRTPLIKDTTLFVIADSLKISFFQEIPLAYVAAPRLKNIIRASKTELAKALALGKPYASSRHFGLMQYVNTSQPMAQQYLAEMMTLIRSQGAKGTKGYFTTRLTKPSPEADLVDFVVFDLSHEPFPVHQFDFWKSKNHGKVALLIGNLVHRNTSKGHKVPFSEEAQARSLEVQLQRFLNDPNVSGVFVKQWQDTKPQHFIPDLDPKESFLESNGLLEIGGNKRMAYQVLKGFYTHTQQTFAISAGSPNIFNQFGLPISVWAFIFALGVILLKIPRTADTFALYVANHGRFREMLKRSSDPLFSLNAILCLLFTISSGAIGYFVSKILAQSNAFKYGILAFDGGFQDLGIMLSSQPMWGFFFGCILYLALTIIQLLLFVLTGASFGRMASLGKITMLTIWGQLYLPLLALVALFLYLNYSWIGIDALQILIFIGLILSSISFIVIHLDFAALVKLPSWLILAIAICLVAIFVGVLSYTQSIQILPEWQYLIAYMTDHST